MIDLHSLENALRLGGLMPETITAGSLRRCKVEGDRGSKRSGAYRLFDDAIPICIWWNWKTSDRGVWISRVCSRNPADRSRYLQSIKQATLERESEQAAQWVSNSKYLMRLWERSQPLTASSPARLYLERRGLAVPNTDMLRFIPKLDYWDGATLVGSFPGMLAAVTDSSGVLVNVHRTYLTSDGDKADVPIVKKLCRSAGHMRGASIKIGTPVPRSDGSLALGIAEGIETSLAASILFGIPVWAGVSAHGMASFIPPPSVHNVYVFADHDKSQTGQKAAASLAERLTLQGFTARIHTPPAIDSDWADELIASGATV